MSRTTVFATCSVLVLSFMPFATAQEEADKVTFDYGFRCDPMEFVQNSDSLQAALVRRHVFHKPNPRDEAILRARIEEILAEQRDDGLLEDSVKGTASRMLELIELGVDAERPEVKRVADLLLQEKCEEQGDNFEHISVRGTRALCLLGTTDPPQVRGAVQTMVDRQEVWNGPWKLCPWGQMLYVAALWDGRALVDTTHVVAEVLTWMADGLNEACLLTYKDPWGLLEAASIVDLPEARRLTARLIPMVLRGQKPDGGWGHASLVTFRALAKHGFLDQLRELPPLPPDWRVRRQIPAPEGKLFSLAWDGERVWVLDRDSNCALALSPEDGAVLKRLQMPVAGIYTIGWWDDGLGIVRQDQKRLVKLDPNSGEITRELALPKAEWPHAFAQVDGELWVYDAWHGCNLRVDPRRPEEAQFNAVAGAGHPLAATPDGVWQMHDFGPVMVKNSFEGELLDWGERPFGDSRGLAWDGENLWALDDANNRICIIERAE